MARKPPLRLVRPYSGLVKYFDGTKKTRISIAMVGDHIPPMRRAVRILRGSRDDSSENSQHKAK